MGVSATQVLRSVSCILAPTGSVVQTAYRRPDVQFEPSLTARLAAVECSGALGHRTPEPSPSLCLYSI